MKKIILFIAFITAMSAITFAQQVNVGVVITQRITKDNGRTEQKCAKVSHDVYDNGKLIIAAGTPVILDIQMEKHKGLGRPGTIIVRPVCTTDIYGQIIALNGAAKSDVGTDRHNAAVACGTVFGIITFPVGLFWLCLKGGKGVIPAGSQMVAFATLDSQQVHPQNDTVVSPPNQQTETPLPSENEQEKKQQLTPDNETIQPVSEQETREVVMNVNEQPYSHGLGLIVGSMNGFSFKTFLSEHFAVSVELGFKVTAANGKQFYEGTRYNPYSSYSYSYTTYWVNEEFLTTTGVLELNVNFIYQNHFIAGLYGFAGGGPSLGWHCYNFYTPYGVGGVYNDWRYYKGNNGKAGVNMIFGLEYVFKAPVSLQVDFRPGYALLFDWKYTAHYFDWGLNLGIRYTFK